MRRAFAVRVLLLKRPVAALLAVALTAALFVGGAQPEAAGLIPEPWDKLAHVGFFVLLTLLLARGFALSMGWVAGVALLVGLADEFHQSFLPGRVASVEDWLADLVGVMLAVGVLWWWRSPTGYAGSRVESDLPD